MRRLLTNMILTQMFLLAASGLNAQDLSLSKIDTSKFCKEKVYILNTKDELKKQFKKYFSKKTFYCSAHDSTVYYIYEIYLDNSLKPIEIKAISTPDNLMSEKMKKEIKNFKYSKIGANSICENYSLLFFIIAYNKTFYYPNSPTFYKERKERYPINTKDKK